MSSRAWQEQNNRYLAESLKWLRLRLERLASDGGSTKASPAAAAPARRGILERWISASTGEPDVPRLTEQGPRTLDERIEQAARSREAASGINPPPALLLLADRLDLSPFERDTLLLCAAMDLDPSMGALCARALGNPASAFPTFGLALSALDDPSWDALSAQRPLRYARLVEVNQTGSLPLTGSALRADERIVALLKGLNVLDARLAALFSSVAEGGDPQLAPSQEDSVQAVLDRLRVATGDASLPAVQLVGDDPGSKLEVARKACALLERRLFRIAADALPTDAEDSETLARLWQRESLLLSVALYIDCEDLDPSHADGAASLRRLLTRGVGIVFLGARDTPLDLPGPGVTVDVGRPTAAEQCEAWLEVLRTGHGEQGGDIDESPDPALETARMLAGQFDLNLADIRQAASLASAGGGTPPEQARRLWDSCRDLTRPRLDLLAQRLEPKATWSDLVLPEEPMGLLRQIAGQVRERHKVYDQWGFAQKMNRGFGISALFAGESGTGKTMAAEVIANELRLNLYRIDLSAVVSKYIGETEKNLRKLFDAAEQGGAILLFDEADALFGKRSEVKDSHDRYANIEINYLLQRMEAFRGLAILATNIKGALDPAFMRRLRFVVNFRFPGVNERRRIWRNALPDETPRGEVDFERLSRLNLTGGNIHSIVLHAAFLAARDGQSVTMPILLSAARTELRKLEKPFNEAQLR